jgi:hypothetical protein
VSHLLIRVSHLLTHVSHLVFRSSPILLVLNAFDSTPHITRLFFSDTKSLCSTVEPAAASKALEQGVSMSHVSSNALERLPAALAMPVATNMEAMPVAASIEGTGVAANQGLAPSSPPAPAPCTAVAPDGAPVTTLAAQQAPGGGGGGGGGDGSNDASGSGGSATSATPPPSEHIQTVDDYRVHAQKHVAVKFLFQKSLLSLSYQASLTPLYRRPYSMNLRPYSMNLVYIT